MWLASTAHASSLEVLVLEPARQIGKRPADIGSDQVEQGLCGWREDPDVQLGIQKQGRHVRTDEDVLQAVVHYALLLDGPL